MRLTRARSALLAAGAAAAVAAASAGAVDVPQSGWSWGSPRPQGNTLQALEFTSGGRGYAAGAFGTVLRTDDGGASWTGLHTGRTTDFDKLAVLGPDALVVGGGCSLRRSDDGGTTFKRLPFAASESSCSAGLVSLAFASPQVGSLLLGDGTVLRTDDGGQTFSRRTAVPGTRASGGGEVASGLVFTSPETGVAIVTGPGPVSRIHRTTDAAGSWTLAHETPGFLRAVAAAPGGVLYAVGDGATLLRSADGGVTWERRELAGAGAEPLTGIRCASADTCLITTGRGDRLLRTDDGAASATAITASQEPLRAVAWADGNRAVAVGVRGVTVASGDGGRTFARAGDELAGRYLRVRATSSELAFAAGLKGAFARTSDGGRTWTAGAVSTSEDILDVSFASGATGYALDAAGTLLRTDNSGTSWRILGTGDGGRPSEILALSGTTILLAGPRGMRRSANGGDSFDRSLTKVALSHVDRAGSAVVAYGRRTLYASTNGGRSWKAMKRPSKRTAITAADFVSARVGYLLDDTGRVFKTSTGGRRWSEVLSAGSANVGGLAFGDARSGWLVLEGFRGSGAGYVLRTDDGGATFRPQLVSPTTLASRSEATPTLVAVGARRGIAFTPGTSDVDDDYGGGFTVSGPQSFFTTDRGGDAGREPRLSLRAGKPHRGSVRISGKLTLARGGERVHLSIRSAGSTVWRAVTVRGTSAGTFSLTRTVPRTTFVVAQWAGADDRGAAASRVLTVRRR